MNSATTRSRFVESARHSEANGAAIARFDHITPNQDVEGSQGLADGRSIDRWSLYDTDFSPVSPAIGDNLEGRSRRAPLTPRPSL